MIVDKVASVLMHCNGFHCIQVERISARNLHWHSPFLEGQSSVALFLAARQVRCGEELEHVKAGT